MMRPNNNNNNNNNNNAERESSVFYLAYGGSPGLYKIAPVIFRSCVRFKYCLLHESEPVVVHVFVVCCRFVQLFQKVDFGTYFVYHNELLVVSAARSASTL